MDRYISVPRETARRIATLKSLCVYRHVERAARKSSCSVEEIMSGSRTPRVAEGRRRALAVLRGLHNRRNKPLFSSNELGRLFGRDHTSVLDAVREAGGAVRSLFVPRRKAGVRVMPPTELRDALRSMVAANGERATLDAVGITSTGLARICAGFEVFISTLAKAERGLAAARESSPRAA